MSLATYADLLASLATWSKRTDLTSVLPDIVVLAEARIARDLRLRNQVATTTLTCVPSQQWLTLPTDFLEAENLTVNVAPPQNLAVVTPELLDVKFPGNGVSGQPQVYAIVGNQIRFGPVPDGNYGIALDYYQRFTPLATSSTNWLLTNHPNVYLSACMAELRVFLEADPQLWDAKYSSEAQALQDADDAALRSGSAMRVRAV